MGRAGRTRKGGERYPGGQLKPQKEGAPPALWGRFRAFVAQFSDPRYANELGRLNMAAELTVAQYETGSRIGDVYRRYHRYKHLREAPRSPNYEQGYGGSADLAEERMTDDQLDGFEASIRAAEEAWKGIDKVLGEIPRNVRQAVLDICVYDTPINPMLYPDLRRALDLVARSWGLSRRQLARSAPSAKSVVAAGRRMAGPTQGAPQSSPTAVPRVDHSRVALTKVMRQLRPDLDAEALRLVSDTFAALRDRENFRARKKNLP